MAVVISIEVLKRRVLHALGEPSWQGYLISSSLSADTVYPIDAAEVMLCDKEPWSYLHGAA